MADLDTLANIAEIIGAIVVVGGFAFAIVQLAQIRRQRRDLAAIELARSFQNAEFARALKTVLTLPDGIDVAGMQSRDPTDEDAAVLVSLTFESVAIMVHRRVVDIAIVWELMGGVYQAAWKKLDPWVHEVRERYDNHKFDEWMQWLSERLAEYAKRRGPDPAFKRHRGWRP